MDVCSIFLKCTFLKSHHTYLQYAIVSFFFPSFLWILQSFWINCVVLLPWHAKSIMEYCTTAGYLDIYVVLIRKVNLGIVFVITDTCASMPRDKPSSCILQFPTCYLHFSQIKPERYHYLWLVPRSVGLSLKPPKYRAPSIFTIHSKKLSNHHLSNLTSWTKMWEFRLVRCFLSLFN